MADLRKGLPLPVASGPEPGRSRGIRAPSPEDALPRHVVSHASGGRDLWSAPLAETPSDPAQAVIACLEEVLDPEIPISLVDLGLIYGVEMVGATARIRLTYTATACPCMAFIQEDIQDRLLREDWIDAVDLEEVWSPPWSRERISERGRLQLKSMGVGA